VYISYYCTRLLIVMIKKIKYGDFSDWLFGGHDDAKMFDK